MTQEIRKELDNANAILHIKQIRPPIPSQLIRAIANCKQSMDSYSRIVRQGGTESAYPPTTHTPHVLNMNVVHLSYHCIRGAFVIPFIGNVEQVVLLKVRSPMSQHPDMRSTRCGAATSEVSAPKSVTQARFCLRR